MNQEKKRIIIIGAGMSGLGAAIRLLENGYPCTILESAPEAGGLAGSFKINPVRSKTFNWVKEKYFNLGYHHVLIQDKPLLAMLKKLGLWEKIAWKKGRVLFAFDGKTYDLQNPIDFFKMPMPFIDKLRFIKLIAYCVLKKDWSKDLGNAQEWLDRIAGKRVRSIIFDPLVDVKYGLPSSSVSANWLGSRLHYQEFSRSLGYMPGIDWTHELVMALVKRVKNLGGTIITDAPVRRITFGTNTTHTITYSHQGNEQTITADKIINTAPPHIFLKISDYRDTVLPNIEYLDALSLIVETNQKMPRDFYLLSCLCPRYSFGGIFFLSNLNAKLGIEEKTVLNFFTTLSPQYEYMRNKNTDELLEIYQQDFEKLFDFRLDPLWRHLTLIKNYSPKFLNQYCNANPRGNIKGLYFAGNYMTYPLITSTGSALESGEKAAECVIEDEKHS